MGQNSRYDVNERQSASPQAHLADEMFLGHGRPDYKTAVLRFALA